ncbi:MAG: histidine triad nucleotide-binding protein [Actinobacteria bacterium]|nr:histidine triad nucleotide-binding protein [Actinomycetota bacterium]
MSLQDCLFCRIVAGEAPADLVMENEDFIAIMDIYPKAPVHALVIPRKHIHWLNDIDSADPALCKGMLEFMVEVADKLGVKERGYRVINNVGSGGGQVIFHLHWHLLAGRSAGFNIEEEL